MFLFLVSILSFQLSQIILRNLSEIRDQASIDLTNVFDHKLITLQSIFLFLLYLFIFIPLNASVYILIYKLSKIWAWLASWVNINEIQQPKHIVKNYNPHFFGFCHIFWVSFVSLYIKLNGCIKNYFIFHSL